jgi:hypothetical protein
MRKGILGSLAALLTGTGLALAEAPPAVPAPVTQIPPPAADTGDPGRFVPNEGGADGNRLWFGAEYLYWWTRHSPVSAPLVTTTTAVPAVIAPGTGAVLPGAIGGAGTVVLLGGAPVDLGAASGGRFTAGYWLDSENAVGVESNYLFLGRRRTTQGVGTNGAADSLNLFVPFFDVTGLSGLTAVTGQPGEAFGPLAGLPNAGPAFPGLLGSYVLRLTSSLQGAEANGAFNVTSGGGLRLDMLGGFRWVQLHESLEFVANVLGQPAVFPEFAIHAGDQFNARNNFFGGQIGARAGYDLDGLLGGLSIDGTAKVAAGDMHREVTVNGVTQTNFVTGLVPGFVGAPVQTLLGGVFAQPSNIGRHVTDRFAVVPEVGVNVGYRIGEWLRLSVGYSFLYLSNVARPGDQIDRSINVTRTGVADALNAAGLPILGPPTGPPRPAFAVQETSYWAQGINFGVEFRY